jgi:4-amino-4-deoxy-L-arabinose transferase-like glycosyltransferase
MQQYLKEIRSAFAQNAILNKKILWMAIILIVIALLKIFILSHYDLHSEEAQYWLWSKRLQLSYYSKPPLIAYLNWFSTSILGNTVFAIRINAVILGIMFSVASYLLAYELFKNQSTAIFAAIVTNVFPLILSNSIFFLTDAPLIFFWLCCMLFYWKAAESLKPLWWILFGISLGLGALSKYSIFLIFIPLVLFSRKYHPEIFKTKHFYISILIGLIFFSPVIYWNIKQNGVGFLHLFELTGVNDHTNNLNQVISNMLEYTIGQICILLPFYQYKTVYLRYRNGTLTKQMEFLILPAISMFLVFLFISIIRRAGVYINWTIFAYAGIPTLFAHLAISEKKVKLNLRISFVMGFLLLLFIGLTVPANKTLPLGNFNPLNKTIGWSQLAEKIDRLKNSMPRDSFYVFSSDYHITSELWFYLKGQPETYLLNLNTRMTQFDLWIGTEQFINTNKTGIYVNLEKISPEIKQGFSTILKEDSCAIYSQDQLIHTFYIYFLRGQKGFQKQHSSY